MEQVYIEPSGRLLMSIGRDLIKDTPAALVELVKNSYDADATKVNIDYTREKDKLIIVVKDDGHGMSRDTVVNSWMTPATDFKLRKKKSPGGRIYQGRKGIGRYAVSLLGNKLKLVTINEGEKTTALFDWNILESAKKLSDIPIDIRVEKTDEMNQTELTITNDELDNVNSEREVLSESDAIKIEKELAKLLSSNEKINIQMSYNNFFSDTKLNGNRDIEPYAFDAIFHYRLIGYVNSNFDYQFYYQNNYNDTEMEYQGNFLNELKRLKENNIKTSCGDLFFDYKVFDKDSEGIDVITDFLNGRGNVEPLTSRETRKLMIDNSGISIYRNGFRIRPYGDKGFDWINLDSKRVQNPSGSIGFDQINGQIEIMSEELSGLKEKSARDGLYENEKYFVLQQVAIGALSILEKERVSYRSSRKKKHEKKTLEKLFDFSTTSTNIEKQIQDTFEKIDANPKNSKVYFSQLQKVVSKEIDILEKDKQETFEEIKEEVAIYQKHATLGNVINIVLHEGRKPLTWYSHIIPRLIRKFKKLSKNSTSTSEVFIDSIDSLEQLQNEANRLSRFFKRLDPLSSTRRKKAKTINFRTELENITDIFTGYAEDSSIQIAIDCSEDIQAHLIEEDIYMAITNIIENSIFWVDYSESTEKKISIMAEQTQDEVIIDILDNGPGIPEEDIKSGVIFVPGYSGKKLVTDQSGTGLGLAIAGEALTRNNGVLEAVKSDNGAHFRIKFLKEVL